MKVQSIDSVNKMEYDISDLASKAKQAYYLLSIASTEQKNKALIRAAELLEENQAEILSVNQQDIIAAKAKKIGDALIDRLLLTKERISGISNSLIAISELDDPVGKITFENKRPNGLLIERKTIPLGVIGIIYESRPNVTADAWALCLKSGNAALLRPGSESFLTSRKIMQYLKQALKEAALPEDAITMIPTKDRDAIDEMLQLDEYIDVIVPRGGRGLIEKVLSISKIPVFRHLDGNCHTYIHEDADLEKAIKILVNAKMRRTGICGATESVVIDRKVAEKAIPEICKNLSMCEICGDQLAQKYSTVILPASEEDYKAEYLDKKISIKIVEDISEAIRHINKYSSSHTEAIITENHQAAEQFLNSVDSAIVMHNSSTQFADGGEFGLGAEIGISTGRMHARGPVGLEQLVTYKYLVYGNGQIRD